MSENLLTGEQEFENLRSYRLSIYDTSVFNERLKLTISIQKVQIVNYVRIVFRRGLMTKEFQCQNLLQMLMNQVETAIIGGK